MTPTLRSEGQNNFASSKQLLESWIKILHQALNIVPTQTQFPPVNTPGKVDCIMNCRSSAIGVLFAFIWQNVFRCIYS